MSCKKLVLVFLPCKQLLRLYYLESPPDTGVVYIAFIARLFECSGYSPMEAEST